MKIFERFYNPFKPHIVSLNDARDGFYVRKLTSLGFCFLDNDFVHIDDHFWMGEMCGGLYWQKNGRFKSFDDAKRRLRMYQDSKRPKFKRIKVDG